MPKIPLYNQGLGPKTRMATGSLSPRASSSAFESVGFAQAKLGQAISDVAQVAAKFEEERQNAENQKIADEYSSKVRDGYKELNSRPISDVDEYRAEENVLRQRLMGDIDNIGKLGTRQRKALKDSIGKYANLFAIEGEGSTFKRFLNDASETASATSENMLSDITSGTVPLSVGLEKYSDFHDAMTARGISLSRTKEQFKFEALARDVNMMAQDDDMSFDVLNEVNKTIMRGQGDYEGLDVSERGRLSSILNGRMEYLGSQALVKAQSEFDDALATVSKNVTSFSAFYSAQRTAMQAIETYEKAGQFEKASAMRLELNVTEEVSSARDRLAFANPSATNSYLQDLRDEELAMRGEPGQFERDLKITKAEEFFNNRASVLQQDPAAYVTSILMERNGKPPTRDEIASSQLKMGFDETDLRVITNEQASMIVQSANDAQSPRELAKVMSEVGSKYQTQTIRQLKSAGLKLSQIYVSQFPDSPMSMNLFNSGLPEALKIQVTPTARQLVRQQVINAPVVQGHLKSLLGGGYADFMNRAIKGASSDTRATQDSRQQHVDMLTDLTLFLIQQDNKVVTGDAGDKITKDEMKNYADSAASMLSERFSYIDGSEFGNSNTSLRIEAHRVANKPQIVLGLKREVRNLEIDGVFYEDTQFEEGTTEYELQKQEYFNRVKANYGWIASNDGEFAVLVDESGGVVFEGTEFGPQPIMRSFDSASVSASQVLVDRERISQEIKTLTAQRQEILRNRPRGGGALAGVRNTPQYDEMIAERDRATQAAEALQAEINELRRSRVQAR